MATTKTSEFIERLDRSVSCPNKLVIREVPAITKPETLWTMISQHAVPTVFYLHTNLSDTEELTWAFVEFKNLDDAEIVINELHNKPKLFLQIGSLQDWKKSQGLLSTQPIYGLDLVTQVNCYFDKINIPEDFYKIDTVKIDEKLRMVQQFALKSVVKSAAKTPAVCVGCGGVPKMKCSRCFDPFCSVECQRNTWSQHKPVCIAPATLIPMEKSDILQKEQLSANLKNPPPVAANVRQFIKEAGTVLSTAETHSETQQNPQSNQTLHDSQVLQKTQALNPANTRISTRRVTVVKSSPVLRGDARAGNDEEESNGSATVHHPKPLGSSVHNTIGFKYRFANEGGAPEVNMKDGRESRNLYDAGKDHYDQGSRTMGSNYHATQQDRDYHQQQYQNRDSYNQNRDNYNQNRDSYNQNRENHHQNRDSHNPRYTNQEIRSNARPQVYDYPSKRQIPSGWGGEPYRPQERQHQGGGHSDPRYTNRESGSYETRPPLNYNPRQRPQNQAPMEQRQSSFDREIGERPQKRSVSIERQRRESNLNYNSRPQPSRCQESYDKSYDKIPVSNRIDESKQINQTKPHNLSKKEEVDTSVVLPKTDTVGNGAKRTESSQPTRTDNVGFVTKKVSDATRVHKNIKLTPLGEPGDKKEVYIVAWNNTNLVVCDTKDPSCLSIMTLSQLLSVYMENGSQSLGREPEIGECVIAPFDGMHNRAVIVSKQTPETFEVLFIDFGHGGTVSSSNIYPLPDEFVNLPCIANQVRVPALEDEDGKPVPERVAKAKELLQPYSKADLLILGFVHSQCAVQFSVLNEVLTPAD